jgi:hypothetical protein
MTVRSRTAWDDYFPGTNPTTPLIPKEYGGRQTVSNSYVYILNCLFNKCTSTSDGGALYCTVTYLLVESSSFISCKTSGYYGALYFSNTNNGECVLHKVCGNDCCSTGSSPHYNFADLYVKDTASNKNYVNYTSIVRCVTESSNSWCTFYLRNGKICCPSVNMSMNKCAYYSAISCNAYADSSSFTCSLTYSSFVNNYGSGYRCVYFNKGGSKHEMICCNVLRNTQGSNSNGVIESYGTLVIKDSCILENTANYIYYVYSSYSITLSNCTVDKTKCNQNLIIQNTVTKSFILGLDHMSTLNCQAEYDSAGTLTAIPSYTQTKKIFCNTYFHCQARISDFFSLAWVLIVTFIHPNPQLSKEFN